MLREPVAMVAECFGALDQRERCGDRALGIGAGNNRRLVEDPERERRYFGGHERAVAFPALSSSFQPVSAADFARFVSIDACGSHSSAVMR